MRGAWCGAIAGETARQHCRSIRCHVNAVSRPWRDRNWPVSRRIGSGSGRGCAALRLGMGIRRTRMARWCARRHSLRQSPKRRCLIPQGEGRGRSRSYIQLTAGAGDLSSGNGQCGASLFPWSSCPMIVVDKWCDGPFIHNKRRAVRDALHERRDASPRFGGPGAVMFGDLSVGIGGVVLRVGGLLIRLHQFLDLLLLLFGQTTAGLGACAGLPVILLRR